jgi:hypothetical protein
VLFYDAMSTDGLSLIFCVPKVGSKLIFFNHSVGETYKTMKTRSVKFTGSGRNLNWACPCTK